MSGSVSRSKGTGGRAAAAGSMRTEAREERQGRIKALVLKKLQKANYLNIPSEQHEELALTLSSETRMRETYFADLLGMARDAVETVREEKKFHEEGIRTMEQQKTCADTIALETGRVQSIQVKLALAMLGETWKQRVADLIHRHFRSFQYGAFHAAIIVGDIVLEWNDSSLVIPRKIPTHKWLFYSSVHSSVETTSAGNPLPLRATGEETNKHFDLTIDKIDGIRMEKEILIDALVKAAVTYNTKYNYDIVSNNCQNFARDCLKTLGIVKERFPFEGQVKELASLLVNEGPRKTACRDFATHEELDEHIATQMEEMTRADLQYCICLYHIFHQGVECSNQNCRLASLQNTLEKSTVM